MDRTQNHMLSLMHVWAIKAKILLFMQFFLKIFSGMANNVDPDQTAQGLHCLNMPFCQKFWYTKF